MASIVKHTDKRSGITYVYESVSYWDKETKMPRCRRTYQKTEESPQEKILARLKGIKVSELKKEIVRLELENKLSKAYSQIIDNRNHWFEVSEDMEKEAGQAMKRKIKK